MKKLSKLIGASLLLASSLALAQTPYKDDTVYRGLGGKDGIKRIVDTSCPLSSRIRASRIPLPISTSRRSMHACRNSFANSRAALVNTLASTVTKRWMAWAPCAI
jgi:hypothetical protein